MWILPSGLLSRSSNVGGSLQCAWCDSTSLKEVDRLPPDRIVYRCKKCNKPMTYITTPLKDGELDRKRHRENNPYAHIKKGVQSVVNIPGIGKFKIRPH